MASTGLAKPQLLNIPSINAIRANHPPTADAILAIVDYINKTVTPPQGNKRATRSTAPGSAT